MPCWGCGAVDDEGFLLRNTARPVSHITASMAPYNKLTWTTVHENSSPCDSWWASGLLNITFLGQLDQRSRNSSGIRMSIVHSAFAGHCAELTARQPRPNWDHSQELRQLRCAGMHGGKSQSWIHTLRSPLHCRLPAAVELVYWTRKSATSKLELFLVHPKAKLKLIWKKALIHPI